MRSRFCCVVLLLLLVCGAARAQAPSSATVGTAVQRAVAAGTAVRVVVALEGPSRRRTPDGAPETVRPRQVQRLQDRVLSAVPAPGLQAHHRYEAVPAFVGRVTSKTALDRLAQHPAVRRIDRDVGGRGGLDTSVGIVGADRWQATGVTGTGVRVAVLDSGLDTDHVDLGDDLVHQACFLNINGVGQCPDGSDRQIGPGAAADDHGHGTRVSGIVTSAGTRAPRGVAPDAEVVAVKVLDSANRFTFFSEIVEALDYLLTHPDLGVDVVNLSLGTSLQFDGPCDATTAWNMAGAAAVEALREQGVLTLAASMNKGSGTEMASPACLREVVSVGATTGETKVAPASNSPPFLDLVAPGTGIRTTGRGNRTTSFGGTSAAVPHASGCAALLRAAGTDTAPDSLAASLRLSPVEAPDPGTGRSFPRLACYTANQPVVVPDLRASVSPGARADGNGPIPVVLRWRTLRERRSEGFIVERRPKGAAPSTQAGAWTRVGFVDTKAPAGRASDTLRYRVEGPLPAPGRYEFRLRHATAGTPRTTQRVRAETALTVPIRGGSVSIGGPQPNPTRGRAAVHLVVEAPQHVRVALYDALGRRVQVLYDAPLAAQRPLLLRTDPGLASGPYVVRLTGETFTATRTLVVAR